MRMQEREEAIRAVEEAIRAPVAETPLLGSHFEPEHEDEAETPQSKVPPIALAHEQKGSVPPPPNAFSEAEALRWPAIREALADETRSRVGQGLAVRVVRGYAAASDTAPKVAAVLEKTVTWRREYDVDAALTKPAPAWETYQRLWPCFVHGTDEHGRLVVCERFGSMDVAQLLEEVSRDDMRRNRAQTLEIVEALQARASAKHGTPDLTEHVHVFDLSGLRRRDLGLKTLNAIRDMVGLSLDHYPGAMETLYVTNTPVVFQLVWRIIKPMLPAEVLGRVHLCGGAREFLPKMIGAGCPLSSIPAWMAVPKQKLKGQHVGVSVEDYVRAIEAGTSSLPRETSLRLRRPDDDGDVLDGAGRAILRRGRVCKRGRRTNAVNPNHVELILYAPGRLAWSRTSGAITSVAVARCDLRRPGSHTFCIETPFGHERSFRCERTEDALAWVNAINAILMEAPCSPGFRREHFAHTPIPPWRRRLRNFLFYALFGLVLAKLVYLTHWLQWRVLRLTLALYVISLVCGFFNPIEALLHWNPHLIPA